MTEQFDLTGRVVLVASAGESWVESIAVSLLEAGAAVMVLGTEGKALPVASAAADELRGKLDTMSFSTIDYPVASMAVERVVGQWGKLDVLVNSLNLRLASPALDVTDAEWEKVMGVNLHSAFDTCRAAGKHMLKRGYGKIINITSCLGERGMANSSVYCAAAGGVIQLTRALALEWAKRGVTVNAVTLGWLSDTQEAIDERVARFIPLRRYGNTDELAPLIVYLASAASDYLTGQTYSIDGGITSRV